jgi:hypothetical protein
MLEIESLKNFGRVKSDFLKQFVNTIQPQFTHQLFQSLITELCNSSEVKAYLIMLMPLMIMQPNIYLRNGLEVTQDKLHKAIECYVTDQ